YVGIHDYKSVCKQMPRQPQRIKTVGLGEDGVLDIFDIRAADAPNALRLEANHDRDLGDSTGPQIGELALDKRHSPQFNQALYGFAGNRFQTRAFSGRENDRPQVSPLVLVFNIIASYSSSNLSDWISAPGACLRSFQRCRRTPRKNHKSSSRSKLATGLPFKRCLAMAIADSRHERYI